MSEQVKLCVLCGGVGPERKISLVSGRSVEKALRVHFTVRRVDLEEATVPDDIDPEREVVFPALHGEFGEDGHLQTLLEERGIFFAGSDALASRLCMQKTETKEKVSGVKVRVVPGLFFSAADVPDIERIVDELGEDLILKPDDQGSSVNLKSVGSAVELRQCLESMDTGRWLVERRIRGREFSLGILNGESLGVVELLPRKGIYDYEAKYSEGMTEYRFPAELGEELETEIREMAERAFQVCGCRDFARVDLVVSSDGDIPYFMEINTLPGLTPTSLLPKSASCRGLSFEALAGELVKPALARHRTAYPMQNF